MKKHTITCRWTISNDGKGCFGKEILVSVATGLIIVPKNPVLGLKTVEDLPRLTSSLSGQSECFLVGVHHDDESGVGILKSQDEKYDV